MKIRISHALFAICAAALISGCSSVSSLSRPHLCSKKDKDGCVSCPAHGNPRQCRCDGSLSTEAAEPCPAEAGVASRADRTYAEYDKTGDGLVYYLPMRYVEAVFRREKVDVKALTEAQTAAATAHKVAQTDLALAESAMKQAKARTEALLKSGMATTAEKYHDALLAEIDTSLAYTNAVAAAAKAQQARDQATKALMSAEAAQAQCGYVDTFSFVPQNLVADTDAKYVLQMEHSWFRNDEWSFKTTTQGLLSTVDSVNDDQSAQILVALAQARVAGGAPGNAYSAQFMESRNIPGDFSLGNKPRSFCDYGWSALAVRMLIDPMDKASLALFIGDVNRVASVRCKPGVDCGSIVIRYDIGIAANASAPLARTFKKGSNGVFYRRELPVNLSIFRQDSMKNLFDFGGTETEAALWNRLKEAESALESKRSARAAGDDQAVKQAEGAFNQLGMEWTKALTALGERQTVATFQLMLPNASPAEHLPLKAGSFVRTHHALEFDQGMLISVKSERPSELLRIASTPWEIAKATMGVVGEIVKFRVDYASQDAALIEQQANMLEQLRLQLEAQRELDAARGNDDP